MKAFAEHDVKYRLEMINKSMAKSFLPTQFLLIGLMVFLLVQQMMLTFPMEFSICRRTIS